ncbi:hypothetical protein LV779_12370 [Streptomyces thinghirensis]|nr:hypothetical protein [Streptomyces thinghirensis]
MDVTRVLMVAPVGDVDVAVAWYERLLRRPADARPMPSLAGGTSPRASLASGLRGPRAGLSSLLNLEVPIWTQALAGLVGARSDGRAGTDRRGANPLRAALDDPDGNQDHLVGEPGGLDRAGPHPVPPPGAAPAGACPPSPSAAGPRLRSLEHRKRRRSSGMTPKEPAAGQERPLQRRAQPTRPGAEGVTATDWGRPSAGCRPPRSSAITTVRAGRSHNGTSRH